MKFVRLLGIGFILCTAVLVAMAQEKKPLPEKVVVLTFDDAVRSQYTFVAPLLKEYGFGATFYVCEFPHSPAQAKEYLSWEEIAEMNKMGFEIGNHTRTHAHIGKIPEEKVHQELDYIDYQCEKYGIPQTTTFAYPGYGLNGQATPIFQKQGFTFARAGWNRCYDPTVDHPYLVPSFDIAGTDEQKVINFLKKAEQGKIVVLTIHGVPDNIHPWVNTPPKLFEKYMKFLKDNNYTVIGMRDLCKYVDTNKALQGLSESWEKYFHAKK